MKGAVFFSSKYGSTAQYAQWIAQATSLPAYNIDETRVSLSDFDFLVLGSPVIYFKPTFHRWVKRNLVDLLDRPAVFFSVSGAGAGPKLDGWLSDSLPASFMSHVSHVALCGRQDPKELTRFDRTMLIIAGLFNRDRKAAKDEMRGFDQMDRSSIGPIVKKIRALQAP